MLIFFLEANFFIVRRRLQHYCQSNDRFKF